MYNTQERVDHSDEFLVADRFLEFSKVNTYKAQLTVNKTVIYCLNLLLFTKVLYMYMYRVFLDVELVNGCSMLQTNVNYVER